MSDEQKSEPSKKEPVVQRAAPAPVEPDNKKDAKQQAGNRPATAPQQQGSGERRFEGFLTEVVEVSTGRTGIYGEIKQAMCRILEGKDRGRVIRRNVAGRMRVGDMMRLPDTSREDKPIRAR